MDKTSAAFKVGTTTIASKVFHYLICLSGLVLAAPLLLLIRFAIATPITISGAGYLIGYSLAVAGMIMIPLWRKVPLLMILNGVTVIILIACLRIVLAKNAEADSNLTMILLPQGKETRWINYLIDEQDSILFGEAALLRLGGVWPHEQENIVHSLYTGYSELKTTQSVFPSPFVSTYLNFQKATSFDTIVIDPEREQSLKFGIVFLHGYMGNVTIQCWRIAQAVQQLGAITVCPSTDWTGEWWEPQGQAMVRATFRYLHERGIQTIYLGGFSNGSIGTSRLAPTLANEDGSLRGLILIAGVINPTDIRQTGLPVLLIQGSEDQRMPATLAREFVAEVGGSATYVEIQSDHFLIMKEPVLVQKAITTWLEAHASDNKPSGQNWSTCFPVSTC